MVLQLQVPQLVGDDEEALRRRHAGEAGADDDGAALVHEAVDRAVQHLEANVRRQGHMARHALDVGLDGLALGMRGRDLPAGGRAGFQLVDELVDQRIGVCSGGDQERRRQSGDGLDTAPASVSLVETSL